MTSPPNSLPEISPPGVPSPPPPAENPPWTIGDVLVISVVALVAITIFSLAALWFGSHSALFRGMPARQLMRDPLLIIPAQFAAYMVLVLFMYLVVRRAYGYRFLATVRWNWPRGTWIGFLALGCIVAIAGQLLSALLPIPKSLPIDQFFHSPADAWMMASFGIAVAPFVEELFFRGFLYPVAMRGFYGVFSRPKDLRNLGIVVIVIAVWGELTFRLRGEFLHLASGLALLFAVACLALIITQRRKRYLPGVFAGIILACWGPAAAHLDRSSMLAITVALFLVGALFWGLAYLEFSMSLASRTAVAAAIGVTAFLFALLHSAQLGNAWGPLVVLFVVGAVLTAVRAFTQSVASSMLVHIGYNLTLFGLLFVASGQFQHLERVRG
ncbi:MAG: lysostaphin resistance A-like protein [Chlamydiota bacterium]